MQNNESVASKVASKEHKKFKSVQKKINKKTSFYIVLLQKKTVTLFVVT